MFPIRDHNPSTVTPYMTWALIVVNIVVFVSYYHLFSDPRALSNFYQNWGLVPAQWQDTKFTILSSMFLHGGIMHLGGNMLFLWIFGDNLEDELGPVKFLLFYLAGGTVAALTQVFADPTSTVPVVGASGAVAAVMGGYILLFPKARVDIFIFLVIFIRIVPLPAWIMLGLWFGLQVVNGSLADPSGGGVAYWAHAGGFVAGVLMILPMWLSIGGRDYWRSSKGEPPNPEARYDGVASRIPKVVRRR